LNAHLWGSTEAERELGLPCDRYLPEANDTLWRAVDVRAPAPVVFRWLCQLRAAPYSYDRIDNLGRRSPQTLTEGLEEVEVGQRFMTIFTLVACERDRHITLVMRRAQRLFGQVALTYAVLPVSADRCRLLVKIRVRHPTAAHRALLPWGDLLMMRRQLLNLRDLAQRQASAGG
jgi:hypothetical protein